MINTAPFRFIAIVLIVTLLVMVATPEKANAIEPLMIIGIVGAAVAVMVLIGYLIIANAKGSRADNGPIYVACNGDDCLALATQAAASYGTVLSVHVVSPVETQGP